MLHCIHIGVWTAPLQIRQRHLRQCGGDDDVQLPAVDEDLSANGHVEC